MKLCYGMAQKLHTAERLLFCSFLAVSPEQLLKLMIVVHYLCTVLILFTVPPSLVTEGTHTCL